MPAIPSYGNFNNDAVTTITVEDTLETDNDVLMVSYDSTDSVYPGGSILTVVNTDRSTPGQTVLTVVGELPADLPLVWGRNYEMRITLSPTFQRDQGNNVIDGLLSLRSMHCRHYNTGAYEIQKTIRGRTSTPVKFPP